MADILKFVQSFHVEIIEAMDGAIMEKIETISKENNIHTEIYLNKQAVTKALLNYQSAKVRLDNSFALCCPVCSENLENNHRCNFCPNCGKRLDWR